VKRKLVQKRITVGLNIQEIKHLDNYCRITGRSYTDVMRECIRNLRFPNHLIDPEIEKE